MGVLSNDNSAWRAIDKSELTHSAAHYLMTILHLRKQNGYARVTDVAEHLEVSRGAASRAISLLKDRLLIQEDPNRMLILTEEGLDLARKVERSFLVVESFLEDILDIPKDVAREDACKIENLLNPATTNAIFRLVRVLKGDEKRLQRLQNEIIKYKSGCEREGACDMCSEYGRCIAEDTEAEIQKIQAACLSESTQVIETD